MAHKIETGKEDEHNTEVLNTFYTDHCLVNTVSVSYNACVIKHQLISNDVMC